MRRHCLVTSGNRCAVADAPVPLHKACIFGMSNDQVLCIIHLCSIFYVQERENGFWSLLGGLSEKKGGKKERGWQPSVSVRYTSSGRLSVGPDL